MKNLTELIKRIWNGTKYLNEWNLKVKIIKQDLALIGHYIAAVCDIF